MRFGQECPAARIAVARFDAEKHVCLARAEPGSLGFALPIVEPAHPTYEGLAAHANVLRDEVDAHRGDRLLSFREVGEPTSASGADLDEPLSLERHTLH